MMLPVSARTMPVTTLARVVFPAPLAPSSATTSPWRTSTLTERSARTPP